MALISKKYMNWNDKESKVNVFAHFLNVKKELC
jgi:hypothetical protein